MLTNQEIFDKVVARLTDGRGRAADSTGICRYRTLSEVDYRPIACAVGVLIDDSHYGVALEGLGASHHLVAVALDRSGVSLEHLGLVSSLQLIHDRSSSWGGLSLSARGADRVRIIAAEHGLSCAL